MAILNWFQGIWDAFYECFIEKDRYWMYLEGLLNTIIIALGAAFIGLLVGILLTAVRVIPKRNPVFVFFEKLADLYVTVIRGTPVVLQLMICYFVILKGLKSVGGGILVAAITFGLNSGAYMAEILRSGIRSVEAGQMEAARSLGLPWGVGFSKIVLPQAIKTTVPTIFNEFITLIKETSVAGYVGIVDLSKIQSYVTTQTMEMFMPLLIIAVIYLVVVLGLQYVQKLIEQKMAQADRKDGTV